MIKKYFTIFISASLLLVVILFPTNVKAATFDDVVLKSVVQIRIYDNVLKQGVLSGTGMVIGGVGTILTNYHVAELALTNPDRYQAFACVEISVGNDPVCKILLSPTQNLFGKVIYTSHYDKNLDLALLYVDKIEIGGEWKDWTAATISDFGYSFVKLSNYINKYTDLNIGDEVHAIGYPDYGGGKTIQVDGVVDAVVQDSRSGQPLIASNYKISHGNSGGPVIGSNGKLIGVTVACYTDKNDKCLEGIFIPLPTVNWWYTKVTGQKTYAWKGGQSYTGKDDNAELDKKAWCSIEENSYYDPTITSEDCTCKTGYIKNSGNWGCVESLVLPPQKQNIVEPKKNNEVIKPAPPVTVENASSSSADKIILDNNGNIVSPVKMSLSKPSVIEKNILNYASQPTTTPTAEQPKQTYSFFETVKAFFKSIFGWK